MAKCIRYKHTRSGKRCAKYSDGYGAMVEIPGLSALEDLNVLNQTVNSTDVFVGAAAGAGAGVAVSGLIKKYILKDIKPEDFLSKVMPLIGSIGAGAIMYFLQAKSAPGRAQGHLTGAIAGGAAMTAKDFLEKPIKDIMKLEDVVEMKYGNYGGLIVDEPRTSMGGLIVDEPGRALSDANLADLAAVSMGDTDALDMEQLMELE